MHLYHHKDSNIRKTWMLFALFFLVVIGFGYALNVYFNNPTILIVAVIFSVGMNVLAYWYSDTIALSMARARPVERKEMPELYTIVENLAITAGLPLPKIYVVNDAAPNAFATGRNPQHAVVAVTTGLLERLDRSELEGVIAHELSHIGNWDMLLSTAAVVLVGFIAIAADFLMRSMVWGGMRSRDNDNRGGGALFMALAIIGAILAPIAATLIQLALSRKREFLADASGALLTRYPEGLARALEKISDYPRPLHGANNTTAHLWFANPFKADSASPRGGANQTSWFVKLFMTHPPMAERLAALRGKQ